MGDPESGATFYTDTQGQSHWELPEPKIGRPLTIKSVRGKWQEVLSDDGDTYYYNPETGETSWSPPAQDWRKSRGFGKSPAMGDWVQFESDDGPYWHNYKTGETSWDPPSSSSSSSSVMISNPMGTSEANSGDSGPPLPAE